MIGVTTSMNSNSDVEYEFECNAENRRKGVNDVPDVLTIVNLNLFTNIVQQNIPDI